MRNQVQLITYVDRLSGADIPALHTLLQGPLADLFGGVHLLPFYYPIDGSDAGFDPIEHGDVDARLGNWGDVKSLGEDYELMADLIVNHVSAESSQFRDVLAKGEQSAYWDLFLRRDSVFPQGMSEADQQKIYRPRPGSCFSQYKLAWGQEADFWTTFTSNQIDIDVHSASGQAYLDHVLQRFADNNIKIIRLDAAGYAIKKAGSRCFMLDETFEFINELARKANAMGMVTLAEIHSHHQTQIDIAKRVDNVYDFALPPLILHTLFSNDASALHRWLEMAPRNCLTVLDTHDGIGIIDVGPMEGKPGLLTPAQIDALVERIHDNSQDQSRQATGNAASNVDLYQVNCTYYDALGRNDFHYLLARAIQFFCPGVPQVYYGGLLAETNDMELLAQSRVGRDINRPYLNEEKVKAALQRPVVKALCQLIRLRNSHPAFNGEFAATATDAGLELSWILAAEQIQLSVDFQAQQALIHYSNKGSSVSISLTDWLA